MRIVPREKSRRLRVGAFRQTTAAGGDLVTVHLANSPEDDALDSSLLDRVAAGFKARQQDITGDIGVERGDTPNLIHVTLEILLNGGLAHARGARTEAALRIDYRIVGKQAERAPHIALREVV